MWYYFSAHYKTSHLHCNKDTSVTNRLGFDINSHIRHWVLAQYWSALWVEIRRGVLIYMRASSEGLPLPALPVLTLASRALSQACLNSSWPFASFSCWRVISSWSFLCLTWASSFSHSDRARISLNCFCRSARLFPKTSEGLWILRSKNKKVQIWRIHVHANIKRTEHCVKGLGSVWNTVPEHCCHLKTQAEAECPGTWHNPALYWVSAQVYNVALLSHCMHAHIQWTQETLKYLNVILRIKQSCITAFQKHQPVLQRPRTAHCWSPS